MIRKAGGGDRSDLVAMVGHFIQGTPYAKVLPFRPKKVLELVDLVLEHGVVFVAEVNGRAVGMIAAVALRELVAGEAMADEMVWWVEPAYRQGLVGPRLLKALENWARQKGLAMLKMVAPVGTEVGAFYERAGYMAVETSYIKHLHGTVQRSEPRIARQQEEGAGRSDHSAPGAVADADAE